MLRKLYVPIFIGFAAAFVPVILYFGALVYSVPAAYIAVFASRALIRGKFGKAFWSFGHLAAYLLIFYAAARFTFWLSGRFESRPVRVSIQIVVLLALFSCSFLRCITYSSLWGNGGTYTFWGAVSRFIELQSR